MAKEIPLSEKQKQFCREYIVDLNGTQAATRAGYKETTAGEQASRLLSKNKVQHLIYKLNQKKIKRTEIDANFVLTELHGIASSSIKDMMDDDGCFLPVSNIPDHAAKTIQAIEIEEEWDNTGGKFLVGRTIKIRLWSKDKSLENLGKHLKLFTDKMEVSANMSLEHIIGNSMKDEK